MNLKNQTQDPVSDLEKNVLISLGAFLFFAIIAISHTWIAFKCKFLPCGQSVFAMRAWIIIYSTFASATLVVYALHSLPALKYPIEQGLGEQSFQSLIYLQTNYLSTFKLVALMLQIFVGTMYSAFIYPMFIDYWGFSDGLISNHVTQKERAARQTQESHASYLPGQHKLMKISTERKCRNLKRFLCNRKQIESQIVTVDVPPTKRRAPAPKKEAGTVIKEGVVNQGEEIK